MASRLLGRVPGLSERQHKSTKSFKVWHKTNDLSIRAYISQGHFDICPQSILKLIPFSREHTVCYRQVTATSTFHKFWSKKNFCSLICWHISWHLCEYCITYTNSEWAGVSRQSKLKLTDKVIQQAFGKDFKRSFISFVKTNVLASRYTKYF